MVELLRTLDIALSGWLLVWAFVIGRERWRDDDDLGGTWLAFSWGGLLFAIIIGNGYALQRGLKFTPALPVVTISLIFGLVAQYTAIRRDNE